MDHPRPLVNAVYYPSWKIYKGISPSDLPVAKISTVFYAFAMWAIPIPAPCSFPLPSC